MGKTDFKDCDSSDPKEPYTITGLALALDTTRETLCRWAEDGHELSDTIKKAKTRVEWSVEKMLLKGGQAGGPIFWLKNFGWTDKVDVGHSGQMTLETILAGTWAAPRPVI